MTARIDLSRFSRPLIAGVIRTVDEVHAEIIAWLASTYGWALTEDGSDPAWRLSRLLAARETLLRRASADNIAEVSLAYASGDMLDHIGATYYGLLRLAVEGDDAYRQRLADAPERYAVGLSGPWYEGVARGVTGVFDARFTSPSAGNGTIYIQANQALVDAMGDALYPNGIPNTALLAAVTSAVTADETRQQTDTIMVSACTRQLYDITVTLTLLAEPDSALALADARTNLARLAVTTDRLGGALANPLVAGAAVNIDAALSAEVQITTIDGLGVGVDVDMIVGMDSVAPQARNLVVGLA